MKTAEIFATLFSEILSVPGTVPGTSLNEWIDGVCGTWEIGAEGKFPGAKPVLQVSRWASPSPVISQVWT